MKKYYFCNKEEWTNFETCRHPFQIRATSQKIDLSLRNELETHIRKMLEHLVDKSSGFNIEKILFDPEMKHFPESYWQVWLVIHTWSYNIIGFIHDILVNFCETKKTWFSIMIDAYPMQIALFPDSDIVFYSPTNKKLRTHDKFAPNVAEHSVGIIDDKQLIKAIGKNWQKLFFPFYNL